MGDGCDMLWLSGLPGLWLLDVHWIHWIASVASRSHVFLPVWGCNSRDVTQECGLPPPDPPEYMATANTPTVHYMSACVKVCIRQRSSDVTKYHPVSSNIAKCHQIISNYHLSVFDSFWTTISSTPILQRQLPFFDQHISSEAEAPAARFGTADTTAQRWLCTHCAASPMDPWMPRLPPRSSYPSRS